MQERLLAGNVPELPERLRALLATPWPGWNEPPVYWAMIIGNPSAGKSPALKKVLGPLWSIDEAARREALEEHRRWEAEAETAELRLKEWERLCRKALDAGKSLPAKPAVWVGPEPHIPSLIVNDVTVEKLGEVLSRQPRGCLVARDELAGWLGSMNQYNRGGSDRAFWLEAYGGGAFNVSRQSREARIERLSVALLGGIQPDRLATLFAYGNDDDGLLACFCVVWPEVPPLRVPDRAPDEAMATRAFARLHAIPMGRDPNGAPVPVLMPIHETVRERFIAYCQGVRDGEGTATGLVLSFLGKTPGMIARIALLLSLLDWSLGGREAPPDVIEVQFFERPLGFVSDYLVPMARRAYADAATHPEERAARALGRLIQDERIGEITQAAILSRKLEGLRDPKQFRATLGILVDAGILVEGEVQTGGRPRKLYVTNPGIWS